MIPIETEFVSRGWAHKLIRRAGFVCVFARFRRQNAENVHYEVVRIREGKPYSIAGHNFPAKEQYPSSEQWGQYGWTYKTEDEARVRYNSLIQAAQSA